MLFDCEQMMDLSWRKHFGVDGDIEMIRSEFVRLIDGPSFSPECLIGAERMCDLMNQVEILLAVRSAITQPNP